MREIPEEHRAAWGAFAAGIFESCPPEWTPEVAWHRVMSRLEALVGVHQPLPTLDEIRSWAAAWATANLPPEILLRRRWF
jgi:hypothetical protein